MNSNDFVKSPIIPEIYKDRAMKIAEQLKGLSVSQAMDLLFDIKRVIENSVNNQTID